MKKFIPILFLLLLGFRSQASVTCVAIAAGNWESGSTWSCGHMPTCGDSVYIPFGITVTVTTVCSYGCTGGIGVVVGGVLFFQTGKKLELPCSSYVDVKLGGLIDPGTGGGNSNLISICGTTVWNAGMGPETGPICYNCSVLPVQLTAFTASCSNQSVTLNWATATETNNSYFNIERSQDALQWTSIAEIPGAGNSSVAHNYSYIDNSAFPGTSYYRLKQTDLDGHSSYPGIAASFCSNSIDVESLYPNPSNSSVYFKLVSKYQQPVVITIVNELGQEITSYTDVAEQGTYTETLPTQNLKPGVYLLLLSLPDGSTTIHKPFVISN